MLISHLKIDGRKKERKKDRKKEKIKTIFSESLQVYVKDIFNFEKVKQVQRKTVAETNNATPLRRRTTRGSQLDQEL